MLVCSGVIVGSGVGVGCGSGYSGTGVGVAPAGVTVGTGVGVASLLEYRRVSASVAARSRRDNAPGRIAILK